MKYELRAGALKVRTKRFPGKRKQKEKREALKPF